MSIYFEVTKWCFASSEEEKLVSILECIFLLLIIHVCSSQDDPECLTGHSNPVTKYLTLVFLIAFCRSGRQNCTTAS